MSTTADELREEVRRRYAESARAVIEGTENCGCGSGSCCADGATDELKFGAEVAFGKLSTTRSWPSHFMALDLPSHGRFSP